MTVDNKAIVELLDAALFDRERGQDVVASISSPSGVQMHFPEGWPTPARRDAGRADRAAAVRDYLSAFPDLHIVRAETLAISEGNFVARRATLEGTHRGEFDDPIFGRFPPTGKTVRWNAVNIYRIAEGRICENWVHIDYVGLARQLGWRGPGEAGQ